jgi:plastocyanin
MIIAINEEHLRILSISGNTMTVARGLEGTKVRYHPPTRPVVHASKDILVVRGAFGTQAASHVAGSEVFAGPIPPPGGPVTGENTFVCGQKAAAPAPAGPPAPSPSPGQPERPAGAQAVVGEPGPVTGDTFEIEEGDNFFVQNNFQVSVGQEVTVRVTNNGQNLHNLRIAGPDGEWFTADDFVVPSDGSFLEGGQSAEGTFSLDQEAILVFRCDVHPLLMWGQVSIASQ